MSMNATVYIVTQGEYSDYIILGVFKYKQVAEDFAKEKAIKANDITRIEAWELVSTEFVERVEEVIKNIKLKKYSGKILMSI